MRALPQEDPRTEAATWEELLLQRKIPNKEGGKVSGKWFFLFRFLCRAGLVLLVSHIRASCLAVEYSPVGSQ
jgi:hypothetical protein